MLCLSVVSHSLHTHAHTHTHIHTHTHAHTHNITHIHIQSHAQRFSLHPSADPFLLSFFLPSLSPAVRRARARKGQPHRRARRLQRIRRAAHGHRAGAARPPHPLPRSQNKSGPQPKSPTHPSPLPPKDFIIAAAPSSKDTLEVANVNEKFSSRSMPCALAHSSRPLLSLVVSPSRRSIPGPWRPGPSRLTTPSTTGSTTFWQATACVLARSRSTARQPLLQFGRRPDSPPLPPSHTGASRTRQGRKARGTALHGRWQCPTRASATGKGVCALCPPLLTPLVLLHPRARACPAPAPLSCVLR